MHTIFCLLIATTVSRFDENFHSTSTRLPQQPNTLGNNTNSEETYLFSIYPKLSGQQINSHVQMISRWKGHLGYCM